MSFRLALIALWLGIGTACQSTVKEQQALSYPSPDTTALQDTVCLDGRSLEPISTTALLERVGRADAVLIGEFHGQEQGLRASEALWQAVLEARPDAVLALEFIERDQQILLDDWLNHDEPVRPERFSFAHGNMLLWSKQQDRPVIAANAPRRYARLARVEGYDHLEAMTATQRATFVLPDPEPRGGYRDRFFELFNDAEGHGGAMEPDEIEAFWRAQIVWDATMADSVLNGLSEGHRPVVLVAGRFHVARDGGVPQILTARNPDLELFSVVMARKNEIAELRSQPEEIPLGDAIWVLEDE